MRSSTALLDAVTSLTRPSWSRIPHLRAHIESRQSRYKLPRTQLASRFDPRRRNGSTFITADASIGLPPTHHERLAVASERKGAPLNEYVIEESEGQLHSFITTVSAEQPLSPQSTVKASDRYDGRMSSPVNMYDLMQENNPERLLFGLLDPTIGDNFVRQADNVIFTRAFTATQLRGTIKSFRDIHRYMKHERDTANRFWIRPLLHRFQTLMTALLHIVEQRRAFGHPIGLEIHTHLLKCAFDTGDAPTATQIFRHMMPRDGVAPDLKCYNLFMGTLCWANTYSPQEKVKLRVLPRFLALRAARNPPADMAGHVVSGPRQSQEHHERSVRSQVLDLFQQLSKQGWQGDEHTFMHLMTAMGREGDLTGVKSILKSVWNVDIDMLGAYDEEEIQSPTFYKDEHPLHPTQRLLLTVAHIYGSNNDIHLGIKLVDYISRNYNLYVSYEVWQHLCEWAMVLGIKRSATMRAQGQHTGKVGPDVFEELWKTMTDKPHNITPNIVMLCMRLRLQWDILNLPKTQQTLAQAKDILEEELADLQQKTAAMVSEIAQVSSAPAWDGLLPAEFLRTRRQFLLSSLRVERDAKLVWDATRKILRRPGWNNAGYRSEWNHRQLPRLVEWLSERAPTRLTYTTKTGLVELDRGPQKHSSLRQNGEAELRRTASRLRRLLDTEDHAQLVENIRGGDPDDVSGKEVIDEEGDL